MTARKPDCLVIMPFGKDNETKATQKIIYDKVIVPSIEEALGANAKIYRIDMDNVDGPVKDETMNRLKRADLVVADVSNNNANVSFELGFRIAQGKPFVLISNGSAEPAYWLSRYQITNYNKSDEISRLKGKIRTAYKGIQNRVLSEEQLTKLTDRIRRKEKIPNPFQDRMSAWRVERAEDQVESIQQGAWLLDANPPPAYIALMFEGIMQLLKRREEYWTMTNFKFWSDKGMGATALLEANAQAARKGVNIKRIFLINKKEWRGTKRSQGLNILREHRRTYDAVNKICGQERISARCWLLERPNNIPIRFMHFGLALHGLKSAKPAPSARHARNQNKHNLIDNIENDGGILILPHHLKNGEIANLKLTFSQGSALHDRDTFDYLTYFKDAFNTKSEPLGDFLQKDSTG